MKYYLDSRIFVITPELRELKKDVCRKEKGIAFSYMKTSKAFFRDPGDRIKNKIRREKNAFVSWFQAHLLQLNCTLELLGFMQLIAGWMHLSRRIIQIEKDNEMFALLRLCIQILSINSAWNVPFCKNEGHKHCTEDKRWILISVVRWGDLKICTSNNFQIDN